MTLFSYDADSDQNVTARNNFYLNKNKIILLFNFGCYTIKYDKIMYTLLIYIHYIH